MTAWTEEQLARIGGADELRIASTREDGSLRPAVTIWVVRAGDALFVRSGFGRGNGWFRRALVTHEGRVEAGGVEADVRFEETAPDDQAGVDDAYHGKYDHYGARYVDPVTSAESRGATFRLLPR